MFFFVAFLIFTGALAATAYYVWSVPRQEAQELLANRLRELRLAGGGRSRTAADLVRREQTGRFAPLAGLVAWVGIHRRLQLYIDQANLRYRGSDVLLVCVAIAAVFYLLLGLTGLDLLILRIGISLACGSL